MKFSTISNIGKVRKTNEDSYGNISIENYDFFVVADGMGGHSDGELASSLACTSFTDFIENSKVEDFESIVDFQERAILYANNEVYKLATEKNEKMGTTVVCLCIDYKENSLHIAHVGDSRIYLYRACELNQLTKDHSLINELIDSGALNEEEANHFANKSAVTRAVGVSADIMVDNKSLAYEKGDIILLVTDGLTNELEPKDIVEVIKNYDDVFDISMNLVDKAIDKGGRDNVTVTTIKI